MSAVAGSILAIIVGCATIVATWSGVFTHYVKSSLRWPLFASAVLLVGAGVVALIIAYRGRRHQHGHGIEGIGALLIVFVAALALTPPPLGAEAASGRTPNRVAPPAALEPFVPAPAPDDAVDLVAQTPESEVTETDAGSPAGASGAEPTADPVSGYPISMFDMVSYSIFLPEEVLDQPLELTGFAAPDPDLPDAFRLTRYQIQCCASDALPLQVTLAGAPAVPDNDQWFIVTAIWHGEVTGLNEYGEGVPVMEVLSMTPIEVPAEPYEY